MSGSNLLVNKGIITEVIVNRAHAANSLNNEAWQELVHTFRAIDEDDSIRVVILRGQGEKAFIAGSDISQMVKMEPHEAACFDELCHRAHMAILGLSKPVIAAINGVALGGGCTLAAACDFRIAREKARLGLPEINLGIMPGAGGLKIVSRLIGPAKTKQLVYTGDLIQADEALTIGLVDRVVEAEQLNDEARAFAEKLAEKSPYSLRLAKSAIGEYTGLNKELGFAYDTLGFAICTSTEEKKEAMTKFLNKGK
ncbi:MAG TPA: crotonase [Firmicutes bacterium]|jgi:enoyl-CoA hydratase|nr:crotonase [Bacillota bacterium]